MNDNNEEHEISLCKARMAVIAATRPGTLELVKEYADLENRVMTIELHLAASEHRERAYPVRDIETKWDLRTDAVRVYLDASINRFAWVLFRYGLSARDPLNRSCAMRFDGVSCSKTTRIDLTAIDKYVNGIIGVNGLGVFEVVDSMWLRSSESSPNSDSRHFCLVFASVVIEFLAQRFDSSSSNEDLDVVESRLLGMRS